MNNLHGYNEFRNKRVDTLNEDLEQIVDETPELEEEEENQEVEESVEESADDGLLTEGAQLFDSVWKVRSRVEVPVTLINNFVKKVQAETGEDLRKKWSEQELAEEITKYVITSFMNIENLPVSLITGEQAQPQAQVSQELPQETQVQPEENLDIQGNDEVNVQIESPEGQVQPQSPERAAQSIPQSEEGI